VKDNLYTVAYAAVLGLICALTLTGIGDLTAERIETNAKAEEMRNILGVLGVPFEPKATAEDLVTVFEENIQKKEGEELTLYQYVPAGSDAARATAVEFAGPGLWGPVKGFLSLETDMVTIRGVTFHKQEETPGLGGEIAAACSCSPDTSTKDCDAWFRHQFVGKRIVDPEGKPGIRIVRGRGAAGAVEVDGITGATMTCEKVQDMLNKAIVKIVEQGGPDGQ
jgi:Na+-transporting NADH:ubiquinone oxidoreductase subunit C